MLRVEFDLSDGSVLMTSYNGDMSKIEDIFNFYAEREEKKSNKSHIQKMIIKETHKD